MEKPDPQRILIIKLSAIGDVIHTLPFLEALRDRYPNARIDWLTEKESSAIVEGHPLLDRVIVSERKSWQTRFRRYDELGKVFSEVVQFTRRLRRPEYDLVIDLQGLFKSALCAAVVRGKRKVGPSGGREGSRLALTETVPVDYEEHAVDRYLRVAKALGAHTNGWKGEIPVTAADIRFADGLVKKHGLENRRIVAINPMARWETKLWDEGKFAVLADKLAGEMGLAVVFTGSSSDGKVLERIRGLSATKPVSLAGRTSLKQLACLYKRCALLISTDTGPMHMAAASGCPVVALFGPTAPWRTGPYGPEHVVVQEELTCTPCFKKSCDAMLCMKSITPGMVLDSVRAVLERAAPESLVLEGEHL